LGGLDATGEHQNHLSTRSTLKEDRLSAGEFLLVGRRDNILAFYGTNVEKNRKALHPVNAPGGIEIPVSDHRPA
jgi:hypothetical protein